MKILELKEEIGFTDDVIIIDPKTDEEKERRSRFGEAYWKKRQRKGRTFSEAKKLMRERNYFAAMMVNEGEADALITGYSRPYPTVVKPMLELIERDKDVSKIAACNLMLTKQGPLFLADTTINENPTAKELAKIVQMTGKFVNMFGMKPNIAMLSYSNFGSSNSETSKKIREAVSYIHRHFPDTVIDGEIQADFALNREMLAKEFPFSKLNGKKVNVLIFPNLESANITYKLLKQVEGAESIGPVILGFNKPVHIIQLGASVDEMVNMAALAVVDAQQKEKRKNKV
jgi:malate dehydrogenase (oxaloacetate-decarboxylating)(NADP+)